MLVRDSRKKKTQIGSRRYYRKNCRRNSECRRLKPISWRGLPAAILVKGGQIIQEVSDKIGYVQTGNAVLTSSGILPCKAVIHVVRPGNGERKENEKLTQAINSVLKLFQP